MMVNDVNQKKADLSEAQTLEEDFRAHRQADWVAPQGDERSEIHEIDRQVKENLAKRHGGGRPKSDEPLVAVYMKWPESLLANAKEEARRLNIGYQSFIKMAVTEYIRLRRARERETAQLGDKYTLAEEIEAAKNDRLAEWAGKVEPLDPGQSVDEVIDDMRGGLPRERR
jgi:hypothetical protein